MNSRQSATTVPLPDAETVYRTPLSGRSIVILTAALDDAVRNGGLEIASSVLPVFQELSAVRNARLARARQKKA
ncbi:hypothetical protein [Reyranella massiliensis]|uniref:hypothetical protein n=1 Tax=Reyranella massiliensis TaxID=445220 RepID=UPI0005C2A0CB|nr:hypothetical protein [Reyranella massiliensis]